MAGGSRGLPLLGIFWVSLGIAIGGSLLVAAADTVLDEGAAGNRLAGAAKTNILRNWAPAATNDSALPAQCQNDIDYLNFGLALGRDWALEMADAWGKLESGINNGDLVWEGDYHLCKRTYMDASPLFGFNKTQAKYCFTQWYYANNELAGLGSCVPQSCSEKDIRAIIDGYHIILPILPWRTITRCYGTREQPPITDDVPAMASIAVLCFFGLICLMATLYDVITYKKRHRTNKVQDKPSRIVTKSNSVDGPAGSVASVGLQTFQILEGSDSPQSNGVVADKKMAGVDNMAFSEDTQGPVYLELTTGGEFTVRKNGTGGGGIAAANGTGDGAGGTPATNGTAIAVAAMGEAVETVVGAMDAPRAYQPNTCEQIVLAWSVYSNAPKVLGFTHAPGSYRGLNGIRFLTMAWIILGHSWQLGITLTAMPTVSNRVAISFAHSRVTQQVEKEMNMAVETFFILSAMLTAISFLKYVKRTKGKPGCYYFIVYYLHRYWRLTPVYMLVLMFYTTCFNYLGAGPFYPRYESANCRESWWKNLVYVNNLIDVDGSNDCMGWTWYLANDFQFYVIAPAFLSLLYWVPAAGITFVVLAICGSMTAIGVTFYGIAVGEKDWYYDFYVRPWCRASTYFIGMGLGYLMYRTKPKIRLHPAAAVGCWCVALSFVSMAVYMTAYPMSATGWITWSTFQRPLFGLGVAWIIFACCKGQGGFITSIMSWEGWLPLAKLTYVGYLIHPIIILFTYYSRPKQLYMTDWTMIYQFLGHITMTMGVSFVVSVCLELPFLQLDKIMFKKLRK